MTAEAAREAIADFGFSPRQAGFLLLVLRHAGVCLRRQYPAYAGIVYGKKTQDFFADLVARRFATSHPLGRTARVYHLHHKGLYRAIGEPDARFRKPSALGHAVERLMLLDALLLDRTRTWLASEREKVAYVTRRTPLRPDELPHVTFGAGDRTTVRYFPEKLPIGVDAGEADHVFLYLVTNRSTTDLRRFLQRHAGLLRALPRWCVRLVIPAPLHEAHAACRAAIREVLASPITLDEAAALKARFRAAEAGAQPLPVAPRRLTATHVRQLERAWRDHGDRALDAAVSRALAEALAERRGRVEIVVPPHRYLHFAPLVGTR